MQLANEEIEERKMLIEISNSADDFIKSPFGRLFISRLKTEGQIAMANLENVDPTKPEEIRKLQNQIFRVRFFNEMLEEVKINAENAKKDLIEAAETLRNTRGRF